MGFIHEVKNINQYESLIEEKPELLLSFSTPTCAKCRMLAPAVAAQISEAERGIQLLKIDATVIPELAEKFQVTEVPAFVKIRNGQQVAKASGIISTKEIAALIES